MRREALAITSVRMQTDIRGANGGLLEGRVEHLLDASAYELMIEFNEHVDPHRKAL